MAVSCYADWKAARHSQEERYGLKMRTPSMKTVTLTPSINSCLQFSGQPDMLNEFGFD
jgi:hypothetical protein